MDVQQTFTIYGNNFDGSSTVSLTDVTKNVKYSGRIASENSTQIVINANFGPELDTWSVQVFNGNVGSNVFQFYVQAPTTSKLPPPTLVLPGTPNAPGPIDSDSPIVFNWQSVAGADRYDLFISKFNSSGGYDSVFNTQTQGIIISGSATSYQLPAGVLQTGASYRWNMSTHNSAGSGDANATRFYFQTPVANSTLPPPALVGPGNSIVPGQTISTNAPQFYWQPVVGADRYDLFVSQLQLDGSYSSVFNTQTLNIVIPGNQVSYALPVGYLQAGGTYRWNMSTHNSAGSGPANSSRLYFNVAAPSAGALVISVDQSSTNPRLGTENHLQSYRSRSFRKHGLGSLDFRKRWSSICNYFYGCHQ